MVDNASTDGTAEILARSVPAGAGASLPVNTGFAGGVAAALEQVGTRFVALLNDDAVPDPELARPPYCAPPTVTPVPPPGHR